MIKLKGKEKKVLMKEFLELNDQEMDIYLKIEKEIEVNEKCLFCGNNIVGCAFGIFKCECCGNHFTIDEYVKIY